MGKFKSLHPLTSAKKMFPIKMGEKKRIYRRSNETLEKIVVGLVIFLKSKT